MPQVTKQRTVFTLPEEWKVRITDGQCENSAWHRGAQFGFSGCASALESALPQVRELVQCSRNMMRDWIEVMGDESENSTRAASLVYLRAALLPFADLPQADKPKGEEAE